MNQRRADVSATEVWQAGAKLPQARVDGIREGDTYDLEVLVPR